MKTEREIEKTKDVIRGLDEEQDKIAITVLLEKKGIDPAELREEICDKCCHWPKVCGNQESLDRHCAECRVQPLWQAMFGREAG